MSPPGVVRPLRRDALGKIMVTDEIQRYLLSSGIQARSAILSLDGR